MYVINVEYKNRDDETITKAGTKGKSIEELYYDLDFFIGKKKFYCKNCGKSHKLEIKSITINFTS